MAGGANPPAGQNAGGDQNAGKAVKNKDDFNHYQFVLEIYDFGRQDSRLKLIRQIPLMKDKDNAMVKPKYILKRASFATNGKIMLMIHKRQMHFFDLATGIRLHKTALNDDLKSE